MNKYEMLQLRLEGLTYAQIAEKANISRQRVQQLLSPPKEIRDYVVKKYQGKCIDCGLFVGKSGHVHHDDACYITGTEGAYCLEQIGDKTLLVVEDFNDIDNLILLCISCHRKRHKSLGS